MTRPQQGCGDAEEAQTKNTLLAVAGLSPQVITETLYALHQQKKEIDAIHVITTKRGREAIESRLLAPKTGRFFRYLREYGIPAGRIDFGRRNIHTIADDTKHEFEDIESEEGNELFLRKCLELTFRFTGDEDATVCFSIAGGRKTMSACLMVAAQLYARPVDRIYHVLVTPEFESSEGFFYPPVKPVPVELRDELGRRCIRYSDQAHVRLLHIPFISVRDRLAPELLKSPPKPEEIMSAVVREARTGLVVDIGTGTVSFRHQRLQLMPARLALYAFFAMQKKDCRKPARTCRGCADCYLDYARISERQESISKLYGQIARNREGSEMSDSGIKGLTAENFNSYKGKIRRDLAQAFGLDAAEILAIRGHGRKPDTRYGIGIDRDRVQVIF